MSNFMLFTDAYGDVLAEQQDQSKKENVQQIVNDEDIEMKFSPNLAAELAHTINDFTKVSSKIIKNKYATADDADMLEATYAKIRDLYNASKRFIQ